MKKIRKYLDKVNIFLIVFTMVFSVFFHVPMNVFAGGSYSSSYQATLNTTTTSSQNEFWTLNFDYDNFVFSDYVNNIEPDSYYEVTLNTVLDISFSEFMNIRIPYVVLGDRVLVLGDNGSNIQQYSSTSQKTFVFSGAELQDELAVKLKGYIFKKGGFITNFNSIITISVQSCRLISSDSSNSYQDGYDAGYSAGEEFGYSDGYNNGFSDGESEGFDEGFEAGKDSIDVDSIYMDGYNAGSEVAYVEGFDEGYAKGYAEALASSSSSLNSTSMVSGDKFTVSHSNVTYALPLTMKHFNTKYGAFSILEDGETYVRLDGSFDGFNYDDNDFIADIYLSDDFRIDFESHTYGFHQSPTFFEFNTSPDVYAYRITVKPSRVNYSVTPRTIETRLVLGTQSEIYAGDGLIGEYFVNGSNRNSVFWYVNDYKSVQLCTSYLTQFCMISLDDSTDFSLIWDYVLDVVPYTKQEYNASVSAIEKQTLEMKEQFNDLKNGFDTSSGDAFNEEFQTSLIDYQVAEDSLFQSATDGLSNFEFFDFESVPAVVSGISFVTALMSSVFGAMGGIDGIGIILSVLFSVMLVSMVLGIYRFYQSNGKSSGKGGGKSGGSKGGKSP